MSAACQLPQPATPELAKRKRQSSLKSRIETAAIEALRQRDLERVRPFMARAWGPPSPTHTVRGWLG